MEYGFQVSKGRVLVGCLIGCFCFASVSGFNGCQLVVLGETVCLWRADPAVCNQTLFTAFVHQANKGKSRINSIIQSLYDIRVVGHLHTVIKKCSQRCSRCKESGRRLQKTR